MYQEILLYCFMNPISHSEELLASFIRRKAFYFTYYINQFFKTLQFIYYSEQSIHSHTDSQIHTQISSPKKLFVSFVDAIFQNLNSTSFERTVQPFPPNRVTPPDEPNTADLPLGQQPCTISIKEKSSSPREIAPSMAYVPIPDE